jgi:hypothetical protein
MLMNKFKVFNVITHSDFYWFLYPTSQPFTFFDDHHPSFLTDTPRKKQIIEDFCYCAKDFKGFENEMMKGIREGDPEKEFMIFTLFAYCEQHKKLDALETLYPHIKDDPYWSIAYNFAKSMLIIDTKSSLIPDQWTQDWVKKIIPAEFNTVQKQILALDTKSLYDEIIVELPDYITYKDYCDCLKNIFIIKKPEYKEVL